MVGKFCQKWTVYLRVCVSRGVLVYTQRHDWPSSIGVSSAGDVCFRASQRVNKIFPLLRYWKLVFVVCGNMFITNLPSSLWSRWCVCIHTHTHTHIYIYIYIYIYTHTHIYTPTHTHINIYTHTHTHIYIYIHTHTHIYIYTHTHIYIHPHTHIYIYTHTQTHYLFAALIWEELQK